MFVRNELNQNTHALRETLTHMILNEILHIQFCDVMFTLKTQTNQLDHQHKINYQINYFKTEINKFSTSFIPLLERSEHLHIGHV